MLRDRAACMLTAVWVILRESPECLAGSRLVDLSTLAAGMRLAQQAQQVMRIFDCSSQEPWLSQIWNLHAAGDL